LPAVAPFSAEELGELGGVLGLLPGGLLPVQADLGIALAVGDASHGQVHADLGALAVEVHAQTLEDLLGSALSDADDVLSSPGHLAFLLLELGGRSLALGAELGRGVALMNITTYAANPLSHNFFLLCCVNI